MGTKAQTLRPRTATDRALLDLKRAQGRNSDILEEIQGLAAEEIEAGVLASDYLAWARAELIKLYKEQEKKTEAIREAMDSGELEPRETAQLMAIDDRRPIILDQIAKNIRAAAQVAAELRSVRAGSFKTDPAFVQLWGILKETLQQYPDVARELERRLDDGDVDLP